MEKRKIDYLIKNINYLTFEELAEDLNISTNEIIDALAEHSVIDYLETSVVLPYEK